MMMGEISTDPALECPVCALCGSAASRVVLRACRDRLCGRPGEFNVVECLVCGHWYLRPRPTAEAMRLYYATDYYTHREGGGERRWLSGLMSLGKRIVQAPLALRQGRAVERWRPSGTGRLLDVGCGSGHFMARMHRRGWDVAGIDTDPVAVETA